MNTIKEFTEIKDLLWDNVDAVVINVDSDTNYILDFKTALPEVRLLRAIVDPDDLDELTVCGITISRTGFILNVPFTAKNILILHTIANKYGLKIKKTTYI